jgi:serine-type D-Ala-D-Ala carboxypeptidase/endopeptidase (penicillin-binding protein 4)
VFDDSLFESEWRHPHWPATDLEHWYAAPVGALAANDSCVDVRVTAGGAAGSPVVVQLTPATSYFHLGGTVATRARAKSAVGADLDAATHELTVRGEVAPGSGEHVFYRPVDDPGLFAATVIKETLAAEGLKIAGGVARQRVWTADWRLPAELTVHVVHTSTLAQSVWVANTRSQNFYAECILKTLAAFGDSADRQWPSAAGSWARARVSAAKSLEKLGVPTAGCVFDDGCGLSDHNRVAPRTFVEILVHMAQGPNAKAWHESLAVAGDAEGTLRRLKDERLKGRLTAKSGYITEARALSGYVKADSGRTVAFSLLCNGGPSRGMDHAPARTWFSETLLALLDY